MNVQSIIFDVYAVYAFKEMYSINLQAWVLFVERVRAIVFDECETVVSMDCRLEGYVYYLWELRFQSIVPCLIL